MKIITIYAILDSENNIVSTTHKEKQAIEIVDTLIKKRKTKYKVVSCNGLVIV